MASELERWADGEAYERYVGRWSRSVAERFLRWIAIAPGADWLDVGCGTGALAATIVREAEPRSVVGIDRSPGFVGLARERAIDPRLSFLVGDATDLPVADDTADAAVSGLVLNFVPEPATMVGELVRAVRPGGWIGLYVWDYADRMDFMRIFWDAAVAVDPGASDLDEGARFPVCAPGPLEALFMAAGMTAVESTAIDIPTRFASFDDLWDPFLGGTGTAPTYLAGLDDATRSDLREEMRRRTPSGHDGSIDLVARAWAVRGSVAG